MAEATPLNIADAESVYKAVVQLLIAYPNYPSSFKADNSTIRWNTIGTGTSIGLFPLNGAIYLRKYISGNYTAQLPFTLVYKTNTSTNESMIKANELVESVSKWLEKCGIGFVDNKITLESVKRQTPIYSNSQDGKSTEFAIEMQIIYSHIERK